MEKFDFESEFFEKVSLTLKRNKLVFQDPTCYPGLFKPSDIYKAYHNLLRPKLQNRFSPVRNIHEYITRSVTHNNLYPYLPKKNIKKICLSISGVTAYNALPTDIKLSKNIHIFRNKKLILCLILKTKL